MLVECNPTIARHPKMNNANICSMEPFSLAGLETRLRSVAVPEDPPFRSIMGDNHDALPDDTCGKRNVSISTTALRR